MKNKNNKVDSAMSGFLSAKVPAGLTDHMAEMFSDGKSLKGLHNGETKKFFELPSIIRMFFVSMYDKSKRNDDKVEPVIRKVLGCKTYMQEVEQFTYCNFGGFDKDPDFTPGKDPQKEYWNCGHRGNCAAECIVCKPDCVFKNNLTKQEVNVIKCIADGQTDQEIADYLKISIGTSRKHLQNIREKMGFNHKGEIIKFAFKNNIIF